MDQMVLIEKRDNIAFITINNPPVNSLGRKVTETLNVLLDQSLVDDDIKCLIITGSGNKVFASGADIRELEVLDETHGIEILTHVKEVFGKLLEFPKPTIAAINGHALGGGLELALHCDFRVAVENAKLGLPEVNLAVIPAAGGTQLLPRLIGMARARWLLFSGEMISSQYALEIGLIDRQVKEEKALIDEATELGKILSAKPPLAYRAIKNAMKVSREMPFSQALKEETKLFGKLCSTQDKAEGVRAFLEKRQPQYKGK